MPGSGKSVLATAVVQHLQAFQAAGSPAVLFHFISYLDSRKASVSFALRVFLFQILSICRSAPLVLETFSFATHVAKEKGRADLTRLELKQLLCLVVGQIGRGYIVLDGLDECEDPDTIIRYLSEAISDTKFNLIVFSRPNVASFRGLNHIQLEIDPGKTDADIAAFLEPQIEALYDDDLISEDFDSDGVLRYLLSGANGMFLWARLMVAYLRSSALTPSLRKKAIMEARNPEKLDDMYFRILRLISRKFREEQQLARQVFIWVAHAVRQLEPRELLCVVRSPSEDSTASRAAVDRKEGDLQHTITMVCGSLVELSCGKFRFVHKSVQDFFATDYAEPFLPNGVAVLSRCFRLTKAEAHCEIVIDCLSYLLFQTPASPLSGDIFQRACAERVRSEFPFLEYTSCCWILHLNSSISSRTRLDADTTNSWNAVFTRVTLRLSTYLKTQLVLMSWVESLYIFLPLDDHIALYGKLLFWADWVQGPSAQQLGPAAASRHLKLGETVRDFCDTLQKYYELWSEVLRQDPHHIWQDITAYSPTPFFRSTKGAEVKSMAASRPKGIRQSMKPLTSLSKQCSLSNSLAVLTIWPSL